jgi:hypothetical protein
MDHTARPRTRSEVRIRAKELKGLLDMARPLDAWERYRALNDAVDEAYEVIDISNREARFSLILMGGLNAIVVLGATRADILRALDSGQRVWAAALFAVYAVCAIYFLIQSIEALRPGSFRPNLGKWPAASDDYPRGIRYFEDVIARDAESHWRAWCEVDMAQLSAELAVQHHSMCLKSNVRRVALRRLYAGLRLMTFLVAALAVLYIYAVWR